MQTLRGGGEGQCFRSDHEITQLAQRVAQRVSLHRRRSAFRVFNGGIVKQSKKACIGKSDAMHFLNIFFKF
jgi:hypothetical protein